MGKYRNGHQLSVHASQLFKLEEMSKYRTKWLSKHFILSFVLVKTFYFVLWVDDAFIVSLHSLPMETQDWQE